MKGPAAPLPATMDSFVQALADPTVVVGDQGCIVAANDHAARAFGYAVGELLGASIEKLVPARFSAHRALCSAYLDEPALRRMAPGREVVGLRKDGCEIPIELTLSPWVQDARVWVIATARDITERRAQEAELRKLALVARATDNFVVIVDAGRRIEWVNETFERVSGYTLAEARGRRPDEFLYTPEANPGTTREVRAAMTARRPFSGEISGLTRAGRELWVKVSLDPVEIDGEIKFIAVAKDITELKNAERRLLESQEVLQFALSQTRAWPWDWDMVGGRVTDHLGSVFGGYSGDESRSVEEWVAWVHPDDHAGYRAHLRDYLRGNAPLYRGEYRRKMADGSWRWYQVCGRAFERDDAGRATRMVGLSVDIHEFKQAQQRLAESEALLRESNRKLRARVRERNAALAESQEYNRALFESSPIGLVLCTIEGDIVDANQAYADIIGYSLDETLALNVWDITPEHQHPRDREAVAELLARGRYGPIAREYRHKDGHRVPVSCTGVQFSQGRERFLWNAVEDISEQERAAARLREAREAAERANQAKSAFLAAMSHDIRTPMNGVIGMLGLVRRTELSPDQVQMIDTANQSAHALLELVDEILDVSKIEAGEMRIEHAPMSVRETVEAVAAALAPSAHKAGIVFEVYVDPEIPAAVMSDAGRLRQILFNLVGNAIKFTAVEGRQDGRVALRVARLAGAPPVLEFVVEDNGIGMSQEQQARVFEPFTQADRSIERRFGGTGLGLSICKRLTALLDGSIAVASELGRGTRMVVRIPEIAGAIAPPGDTKNTLAGLRMAVADVDTDSLAYLCRCLEYYGAATEAYSSLDELKARVGRPAGAGRLDVVVLGRRWDRAAKLEVLGFLRARGTTGHVILDSRAEGAADPAYGSAEVVQLGPLLGARLVEAVVKASGRGRPKTGARAPAPVTTARNVTVPAIEDAALAGRLVLLAEDNQVNQDVIVRQLHLLGYAVEVAADGAMALAMWHERRYGLVLTDWFMPDMDGTALARAIRAAEAGSETRTRIVAITANALPDQVQECLAAGMDDYLVKPFAFEALERMLEKWLGPGGAPTAGVGRETTPGILAAAGHGPIDPTVLTQLVGDDPAVHAALLHKFVAEAPAIVARVHESVAGLGWADLRRAAHRLKSAAGAVGATALVEICDVLESAAVAGDRAALEAAMAQIGPRLADVERFVVSLNSHGG